MRTLLCSLAMTLLLPVPAWAQEDAAQEDAAQAETAQAEQRAGAESDDASPEAEEPAEPAQPEQDTPQSDAQADQPQEEDAALEKSEKEESAPAETQASGAEEVKAPEKNEQLGSQQDDRGPIGRGFGKRWIALPTVSSNPKLATAFGATAIVFVRIDDSVASQFIVGGNYSVSKSWTAFAVARLNFAHDTQRVIGGVFRGHAANSYDNFMNQGIGLESNSNVFAVPLYYFHRFGPRTQTDWWAGGQVMYLQLDQSGEDPLSSQVIEALQLDRAQAIQVGPNVLYDSRDNTNSPSKGQRLFLQGGMWTQLSPKDDKPLFGTANLDYSIYFPMRYFVWAFNGGGRISWGAPLIYQSSLSQFRAYTVGEEIARHSLNMQTELRIPFGKTRFGASAFGGLGLLFNDMSDWGESRSYFPMGGAGLRFMISKQQKSIIRLEYANGINGARGIYLAMGQPFR